MEIPYTGSAIIDEAFGGTIVTIPAKKNYFIGIFLCFWLCGWCAGEVFALTTIAHGGPMSLFLLVWLAGWTAGGFFVLRTIIWNFAGKEIITLKQGVLGIKQKNLLFSKPKDYDLREVKRLRVRDDEPYGNSVFGQRNSFNINKNGTILFDYGMKTVRFGSGLDEAEASKILDRLKSKRLLTDNNF